jgi:hypothetical protein
MSNIAFVPVTPFSETYSCTTMNTVEKVLWKGDWILSIQTPITPEHRDDGIKFYVYSKWPLLMFHVGGCVSIEDARQKSIDFVSKVEKMLRQKFFLPKQAP